MSDGLKETQRTAIRQVFEGCPKLMRALLFGSRAMGTYTATSDIDIALEGELSLSDQARLSEEMEQLNIPYKVDLVRTRAISSDALREHIKRYGKLWYEKETSTPARQRRPRRTESKEERRRRRKTSNGSSIYPLRSLEQITENFDSQRVPVKASERHIGTYPYYGAQGIVDYVDSYIFDGEFLLIAEDGENLRSRKENIAFIAEGRFWVNNHAHVVKANHLSNTRFLLYAINSTDISGYITGSTIPKLSQRGLNRIKIPCPDKEDQRAIASLLGALDDKIELNRRMNETLEGMARALFKDWFVDFGPTRAKIEGRPPYLAPEIWELFPDKLDEETGLPEGWKEKPLSDFFSIIGGGTPKTSMTEYWDGEIPWFSVVDTPPNGSVFVTKTEKTITDAGLEGSSARLIPAGTTIISARGTVGNLAMATTPMTFNQSCYGLRAERGVGDCFVFLAAQNMIERLKSMAHGSVFSTITRNTFENLSLPMPANELLPKFEDIASQFFAQIKNNGISSRTLAQTRDLLLPRLMSGEIQLGHTEKEVEAVL